MAKKVVITSCDIVAGLRRLGLRRGDRVMTHSGLSSFGFVEGGAYAVIDALRQAIGPEGTLMFPTFNHGKVEVFDRETTPSYNGTITETFRHLPEVRRSNHPTHAYAALGPDADRYVKDAYLHVTWGPESPLGRLIADGGWILLLGVTQGTSTAQHHGETYNRVKCFGLDMAAAYLTDEEGEVTASVGPSWRSGSCPYDSAAHETRLRYFGAVRDTYIGEAHIQLMRGSETVKAVGQLVRGETGVDHCATCDQRPWLTLYEDDRRKNISGRQPSKWQRSAHQKKC